MTRTAVVLTWLVKANILKRDKDIWSKSLAVNLMEPYFPGTDPGTGQRAAPVDQKFGLVMTARIMTARSSLP